MVMVMIMIIIIIVKRYYDCSDRVEAVVLPWSGEFQSSLPNIAAVMHQVREIKDIVLRKGSSLRGC